MRAAVQFHVRRQCNNKRLRTLMSAALISSDSGSAIAMAKSMTGALLKSCNHSAAWS